MKVREIKKEDIKIGLKVIYKRFYEEGRTDRIEQVSGVCPQNTVNYTYGGWDTEQQLLDNYFLVEDSSKTNGKKHDQDKLKPSLLFNDFPHAIEEVLKVLKFGAEKYSEGNWLKVDNGVERYRNAAHRHMLAQEEFDEESGLLHLAHEATSVFMMLELKLRGEGNVE